MSLSQNSKDLLSTVAAMLSNRAELLGLEFAEERERLLVAIAYGIAAAVLLVFFLLGVSFLVLLLVWESPYRYAVIGAMTGVYAVLALLCLNKVKRLFSESMPFASTIQVFKDDAAKIKGELVAAPSFGEASASSNTENTSKEV